MDGLFKQEHLKKESITVEKRVSRTATAKLQEKTAAHDTMSRHKSQKAAGGDVPPTVPLDEKTAAFISSAADSATDVHVISFKRRIKRINACNALKKKYGNAVTLDTALLMKDMASYSYSGAAAPIITADMFEKKKMEDSASGYDLKNILRTRDMLKALADDPDAAEGLSLQEKTMAKAASSAISQFEAAAALLLKTNCLDESGQIDKKLLKEKPSSGQFIEAGGRYRERFSASLKEALNSNELKLKKSTQTGVDELLSKDKIEDTLRGKHLQKVSELVQKAGHDSVYQEGLKKLTAEFESTSVTLHEKEATIRAMKNISQNAPAGEKEKLEARIACMEQDMDFYLTRSRNKRLERMIKGACLDRPVTLSMKAELKKEYGIG